MIDYTATLNICGTSTNFSENYHYFYLTNLLNFGLKNCDKLLMSLT